MQTVKQKATSQAAQGVQRSKKLTQPACRLISWSFTAITLSPFWRKWKGESVREPDVEGQGSRRNGSK